MAWSKASMLREIKAFKRKKPNMTTERALWLIRNGVFGLVAGHTQNSYDDR